MEEQNKEPQVDPSELKEDTSKGLSTREALEVALVAEKDKQEQESPRQPENPAPAVSETPTQNTPRLEPPAEWEKEDKELFHQSTEAQQRAALKLHEKRNAARFEIVKERESLAKEREQLKNQKVIEQAAEQFRAKRGGKDLSHQDILNAIQVVNEITDSPTPNATFAKICKARGMEVPEWAKEAKELPEDPRISSLQKEISDLKSFRAQEERTRAEAFLRNEWAIFEQSRNAAGLSKYPDLGSTDEQRAAIASNIGSLVNGDSAYSQEFIRLAKERIPGLTYTRLLEEAYKFQGGRIDDSPLAPSTPSTQQHIQKARRAASSVPGRSAQTSVSSPVKRYKTTREAAEAALAQLRERDGH